VPLRPTKGQMLTVQAHEDLPRAIYNKDFYLLPGSGRTHRLGATYEWHDVYSGPTDAASLELIGRVERAMRHPVNTIDAQTAVRPNVADRRPVLGTYGTGTGQHLFNGMGSKGVMLAPFFAHQLVSHIWHGEPLDPAVDMMRFGKRLRI
jgi:glycine/D-amino acid oxidase-like deaminating enzyme